MKCDFSEDLNGGLCYPKCRNGYTGVGPVCWQTCPSGFANSGATCVKPSQPREDAPMICKAGEDQGGALCYPQCNADYTGVGPVCWGGCPANWTQCGAACGKDSAACADKIINMIEKTAEMVANIAGLVTGVGAAAKVAEKVEKVAEAVKNTASVAAKLNELISKIMAANSGISQEDAKTQAENQLAGVMMYQNTDDLVDSTWDLLAEIDPTGILGAAKAFYFPLCSDV